MTDAELRPFQRAFISGALAPGVDRAVLSLPRGNGKSSLCAHLVERALTPGDRLFRAGCETVLAAPSIEQCCIVARMARRVLEPRGGYSFQDNGNRVGVLHLASQTRVRALGHSGKTAMGLGADTVFAIVDEPGALDTKPGELLADAIDTALGKPGSVMRVIYVGTLAPSVGGWWHDLVAGGSRVATYVMALQGNEATWDRWSTIRRCNPLVEVSARLPAQAAPGAGRRAASRTGSQTLLQAKPA